MVMGKMYMYKKPTTKKLQTQTRKLLTTLKKDVKSLKASEEVDKLMSARVSFEGGNTTGFFNLLSSDGVSNTIVTPVEGGRLSAKRLKLRFSIARNRTVTTASDMIRITLVKKLHDSNTAPVAADVYSNASAYPYGNCFLDREVSDPLKTAGKNIRVLYDKNIRLPNDMDIVQFSKTITLNCPITFAQDDIAKGAAFAGVQRDNGLWLCFTSYDNTNKCTADYYSVIECVR